MDCFEAAKLVHDRIRMFESEQIARKVVGYVYLQDHSEQEMIRLALGPDLLIQYLLVKAKSALQLSSGTVRSPPISPSVNPISIPDPLLPYARLPTASPRHRVLPPRLAVARYGQSLPETSHMFGPNAKEFGYESLERLEMEITELLKSRNGAPISIASLPMLYFERYGRTLRAEGYLTESQRHGKAGYSLTKLLAQLNNTIRVIDRPHGQHAIMLAEHSPRYWGIRAERNDPGPIVNGSCQIYLTFPADSTFTEEDLSNYFSAFGTVKDVRIPCQPKRMFGFVSFDDSDTVNIILAKGNRHFVCGARVLVKPYREKKLYERKYHEKFDSSMYSSYNMDINSEHQAMFHTKRLTEEREKELEIQMRRLSSFDLSESLNANQSYLNRSMEELRLAQDHREFRMLNVLNGDGQHAEINNTEPNSNQGPDLPDSPFASRQAASL